MAGFLKELYNELLEVRRYLIKIGPARRKGDILGVKLNEAKIIINQYNTYLENITKVKRTDEDEENVITEYCEKLNSLYSEILKLCQPRDTLSDTLKMDFDLKVALNLLPVMNDEIANTRQLVDGIDYYSSVLDTKFHSKLINFVLKSRLSQGAKLRLASNYDSVSQLLTEMKRILLPQKSANSLQKQLLNLRQDELSIDDFGKKLSEMFVDLTISQSDGNSTKYDILKSINEKQAIKQFSDGLRNRRISTIISAQKFDCLKDAIQAAVDEDSSTSNASAQILSMKRNNSNTYYKNKSRLPFQQNNYRGYNRGAYNHGFQQRGYSRGYQYRGRGSQHSRFEYRRARGRGGYQGNSFNNNYRGNKSVRGHVRILTDDTQPQPSTSAQQDTKDLSENIFFRSKNS